MTSPNTPVLYIFSGDDRVSLEREQERISNDIQGEAGEIRYERFLATDESFEEFISRAMTPSLFTAARIFCIDTPSKLSESELSMLSDAVRSRVQGVCFFVFLKTGRESGSSRSKTGMTPNGFLKKIGVDSKSPDIKKINKRVPREYEMPEWVIATAESAFKRKIESGAAEHLVDMVGSDTGRLFSELNKLDIYLNEGDTITSDAIERMTDPSRSIKPYEIPGVIARGESGDLVKRVDLLFKGSFSAPFYMSVLFSHFWKLARIRSFAMKNMSLVNKYRKNKGNYKVRNQAAFEIGVGAGLLRESDKYTKAYPVMIKPGIIEQAQRYKEKHLKAVFRYLMNYDLSMKSGRLRPDKNSFLDLCFKILKLPDTDKERDGEILLKGRV